MRTLVTISLLVFVAFATAQDIKDLDPGLYAHFDTTAGEFTVELFQKKAPKTAGNFVNLATGRQDWRHPVTGEIHKDTPYYDGIIFHRVIPEFMIQTGDPGGTGSGGPGYTIADEFGEGLRHGREGVVSMANKNVPNSGSAQFFITLASTRQLDGKHAIFGRVAKGIGIIRRIGQVRVDMRDKPVRDVTINKVTILRVPEKD